MQTCPQMQALIQALAARHPLDLTPVGHTLTVELGHWPPDHGADRTAHDARDAALAAGAGDR